MKKPKRLPVKPESPSLPDSFIEQGKIQAARPSWEDYRKAGVIDSIPEPDENGKIVASISGHDKVVRALQMNEDANRLESDFCDERYARVPKAKIKGVGGSVQHVPESQAERRERKHFKPRASIIVPALPWKEN